MFFPLSNPANLAYVISTGTDCGLAATGIDLVALKEGTVLHGGLAAVDAD